MTLEQLDHAATVRSQLGRLERIGRLQSGANRARTLETIERLRAELEQLEEPDDDAGGLDASAFDLWTWTPGRPWTLEHAGATLRETIAGSVRLGPDRRTVAAFATELELDPNRMTADELADMAELVAGPIPDLLRRRHTCP